MAELRAISMNIATAKRTSCPLSLNAASSAAEWEAAEPIRFSADWQGRNHDPALETEVRLLWDSEALYIRFLCRYRELFVFGDSSPNGRRHQLWERDVAEAFLQPADLLAKSKISPAVTRTPGARYCAFYREIEIAPNGMWLDLDIAPAGHSDLESGLSRCVHIDNTEKIWVAELAIPIPALSGDFNPAKDWRANFYRVEGMLEPRRYLAWQPTGTPQPDFHVPDAFGWLRFEE